MTRRALLAIGCDHYDNEQNFPRLYGAEADARALFEALGHPETGDYDPDLSCLLLSPSLAEIRDGLARLITSSEQPDTLTISYAGHGMASGLSFYLCPKGATIGSLSFTALSLGDLFRMIAEAHIPQSYIIIDACQAGGLTADLNVILKSDVVGRSGTPGLSLLAMAASDQDAIEEHGRGVGTAALLDCITGTHFLQDSSAALDLVEIGRAVSEKVGAAGDQTPVVWGLNLCGPPSFCKNPHAGSGNAPLRQVLRGWPNGENVTRVRAALPRLWEDYATVASRWDARRFVDRLQRIFDDLVEPEALVTLARAIAEAFAAEVRDGRDLFREVELRGACLAALLPHSSATTVEAYLVEGSQALARLTAARLEKVIAAIDANPRALLTGGMSDLYYLPLRLSHLLGWSGFVAHQREETLEPSLLDAMLDRLLQHYNLSLTSMSDEQAPMMLLALTALFRSGPDERGEQLFGHMLQSAIAVGGLVARSGLKAERVLDYLLARHHRTLDADRSLVAQPSELMLVLLRTARLFEVTDQVDIYLADVDHLAVSAFLPEDYTHFADEHVPHGVNAVIGIGEAVFRVADIEDVWPACARPLGPGQAAAVMIASLLFPDRSAWFLLPSPNVIDGEAQTIADQLPQ